MLAGDLQGKVASTPVVLVPELCAVQIIPVCSTKHLFLAKAMPHVTSIVFVHLAFDFVVRVCARLQHASHPRRNPSIGERAQRC